jgi:hypothetical protein
MQHTRQAFIAHFPHPDVFIYIFVLRRGYVTNAEISAQVSRGILPLIPGKIQHNPAGDAVNPSRDFRLAPEAGKRFDNLQPDLLSRILR